MTQWNHVLEIESELRKIPQDTDPDQDAAFHAVRRSITTALLTLIDSAGMKGRSLPDIIDVVLGTTVDSRRFAAIITLRAMARAGVISESRDRKAVELVMSALPDFCKFYKISDKAQTFQNAGILRSIHNDICWVQIFCDGRKLIDSNNLVSDVLSGSIARG